jgi:dTDP-glucose 4,6-dehydratase
MRVLVTGADGFVASFVCEYLLERGCEVVGLVKRNSGCILKNLKHLEDSMRIVWGDITDASLLLRISAGVDIVYHLAAQSHVAYSLVNPEETFYQNTVGSLHLLEAARLNNVKRVIHAGSAEVYGSTEDKPLTEESPLIPRSAYAAGKVAVDRLMYAYWASYQTPVVMSRFFGIFGPRQSPEKAVPKFIHQFARDLPVTIYGEGEQTRDFMYVTDCAEAYGKLGLDASDEVLGEVINIAAGRRTSMKQVAETIHALLPEFGINSKSELSFDHNLRAGEAPYLVCQPDKLRRFVDWQPRVTFEDGMRQTIEFYLKHLDRIDQVGKRY